MTNEQALKWLMSQSATIEIDRLVGGVQVEVKVYRYGLVYRATYKSLSACVRRIQKEMKRHDTEVNNG